MKVTQVYEIINNITKEIVGAEAVVNEDLSNIVDVGEEIFDATNVDNYVKKLVDRIGKVVFVDRPYSGNVPSIVMDSFEFGSVIQKISADMPDAKENSSWELTDGTAYPYDTFYQPKVSAKFFNNKITFEIDLSFTERQVKGSFTSANDMNAFISMLYSSVEKAMTVKIDSLVMRTINNMTAETLAHDYGVTAEGQTTAYAAGSFVRSVNLLYLYNQKMGLTGENALAADKALTDDKFIRFASMTMGLYVDRLSKLSHLFNVGGAARFTPRDYLRCVMLTDFKAAANAYLQSDTFHNEFTALPDADTVPYWQGSGTDYAFNSVSAIDVKTSGETVKASGILAVMFDKDACGVSNLDRRVTTTYNPKGEFFTNFYKFDSGYYNDLNENFIVFFIA